MPQARNTREISDRVERILADLAGVAEPAVADRAEELARTLVELYGAGLEKIVSLLSTRADGDDVVRALAADDFVGSLLVLHGLHPVPIDERVQAALDKVRPYLGSHAGGVEYLGIDERGVAMLALHGSCDGCPSSTVTVKLAIERAIEEAAPELAGIEVSGVVAEQPGEPALLQIQPRPPGSAPRSAPPPMQASAEWLPLPDTTGLPAGEVTSVGVVGVPLAVCRIGERLYAYRDACAACGSSLAGGRLADTILTCPDCRSQFDVRRAGLAVGSHGTGGSHLEPVPLVGDGDQATVALAVEVR